MMETEINIFSSDGPTILAIAPSASMHRLLRSKVSLSCEASGNPSPSYAWLQHTEEGAVRRGEGRVLVLTSLQYKDQGRYECCATNTIRGEEHIVG